VSRRADLATLVVAVVVHAAFAVAIARERVAKRPPTSTVELEFARQPPAVARQPAAAPGPQHLTAAPKPRRQLALRAHAAPASHPAETAAPSPPSLSPSPSPSPPTRPIFAVSMASTSEVATGPSLPRGSPTGATSPRPGGAPTGNPGGPAAGNGEGAYQPVSESDVTTMPEIDTDACGKSIAYPDEAEAAGIEGDVRLRVSLTPEGHVYAVHVLSGLGHGLDRAATEALRHRCRFSPAIGKAGKPVAFVIQSYTFHFQLPR
jgi:TonB family protein